MSVEGETTLFQANIGKTNRVIPKTIKWKEVQMPEQWNLIDAIPPTPIENRRPSQIIQRDDGEVELLFNNRISTRIGARRSVDSLRERERQAVLEGLRRTTDGRKVLEGLRRTTKNVQISIYRNEEEVSNPQQPDVSFSDVDSEIAVIERFEIKKDIINQDFFSK